MEQKTVNRDEIVEKNIEKNETQPNRKNSKEKVDKSGRRVFVCAY